MLDTFIISHRTPPSELSLCVESAVASTARVSKTGRVFVRESGDELNRLETNDANVVKIKGANKGYGAACNELSRLSDAKYMLFLNADIRLPACGASVCAAALEADESAAVCGLCMLSQDGSVQPCRMKFPTPEQLMPTALAKGRDYKDCDQSESGTADWVLGAFLMVRRSAFEEVGGFDERFFLYFEETDLCLRLSKRGYKTLYVAEAGALHLCGARNGVTPFAARHSVRSRVLYSFLHFPEEDAKSVYKGALLTEPFMRFFREITLLKNPFPAFTAPISGAISGRRAAF